MEKRQAENRLKECLIDKKERLHLRHVNGKTTIVNLVSLTLSKEKYFDTVRLDEKTCNTVAAEGKEPSCRRVDNAPIFNVQENCNSKE